MKRFLSFLMLLCLAAVPMFAAPQLGNSQGRLQITRAVYGAGHRWATVTSRLNSQIRGNQLNLQVNNDTMGGDPVGIRSMRKTLRVDYTFDGRANQVVINEGDTLQLNSGNEGGPQGAEAAIIAPAKPVAVPQVPQVSQVSLVTQPGNAQAYVDDAFKGVTSEEDGALRIENLTPGSHRLRLTLPGFKEWKQNLTLNTGETFAVQAKLEATGPKPLTLAEVEDAVKNVPKKGVMKWVKEFGVDFAVTDEVEQKLRAAGADAELLFAVARAKR